MPEPSLIRDPAARARALAFVGVLAATLAGAIAAAAARSGWGTIAALAASLLAEVALARRSPFAVRALRRASAGPPTRAALRMVAVLLFAARCLEPSIVIVTAVTAAAVTAAVIAAEALRVLVVRVRRAPLVTRNLDLGDAAMPKPPVALAMSPVGPDTLGAVVAALGLTLARHRGSEAGVAAAGLALATAIAVVPAGLLGFHLIALLRARPRSRLTAAATAAIEAFAPEVVLYFAATPGELYQLRMWLEPLEQLGRRVAVVVRTHAVFEALGAISLPVICTPFNGTLASMPLPARVVALFVTHSGNNLSMLRRPGARSVFIGHGDSDKPDSVNPFARVYDEVWVAGSLGRRRYVDAGIGVDNSAIVEIGRPGVAPSNGAVPPTPTIVYAPTWEGWGDDPHHSSLAHVGPALIESLISRPNLRVRYRPHPLTGRRNPALRAASQRIVELVGRVPPDEPVSETLARSSALIGDVSSVINEYLAYDRPYGVVDTRGLGRSAFAERFPSTAGGVILEPDLAGLDSLVAAAIGGADPTAEARRALVADAIGDPATSQQRFADAVSRLLDDRR